jgi:hypothetical protein
MLHFGMKPPFSFEKFLQVCRELIPENDIKILKTLSTSGGYADRTHQPTLERWRAFEAALRNELVKLRAARKHSDPLRYLRPGATFESSVAHIAVNAYREPSILEAERLLDRQRWNKLDELSIGHYFDFDSLIVFGLKLLILLRWERINTADKSQALEKVLQV